jgi:hypothetical protein
MPGIRVVFTHQQRVCGISATVAALLSGACLVAPSAVVAAPESAQPARNKKPPRPAHPGDILSIFDNARVYVITNDPAGTELADALLAGCQHKQRRVITTEEWAKMPEDVRLYVSTVFLVNREALPANTRLPEKCTAEGTEVYTEVVRSGRSNGFVHEVTLSAPDSAWLRQAISDFRRLSESPRGAQRRNVRSMAVIPMGGAGAKVAAQPLLAIGPNRPRLGHLLPAESWHPDVPHRIAMDEAILIDRSGGTVPLANLPAPPGGKLIGKTDTVAWREIKPDGKVRVVFSAPTEDQLVYAVRQYSDNPLAVPETLTVLHTARDLRSVRRVAVAGLFADGSQGDLARVLASRAATELRAMDSFEVLERAGLNQVLSEIALEQAGLTESGLSQAKNRNRLSRMAAADALLIVEITSQEGNTAYDARYERITPRLNGPPRRPLEPSRLKYAITLPGKENDPLVRAATDALLSKAIGTKTDREYREAMNQYNDVTLPQWQAQVDAYYNQQKTRPVSWRQQLTARRTATINGSLRLVDLTDGLVLWEAPFSCTQQENDNTLPSRTVTTSGEDSQPNDTALPRRDENVPEALLLRTGDKALSQSFTTLKGTAILPAPVPAEPTLVSSPAPSATAVTGRILDVDGDQVLIGLGQTDGLKIGDTLSITLEDGKTTVRVVATRIRPRTCDAIFDKSSLASLRAKVAVGQSAMKEVR